MWFLLLGFLTFCSQKRDIAKENALVFPPDMKKARASQEVNKTKEVSIKK